MLRIKQLLVDLYGCKADLNDDKFLVNILEKAAVKAGSTVVDQLVYKFHPVGVSVFLILAETHISIQTWPEHGYAAVDIFICGEGKSPSAAWELIKKRLMPGSFEIKEITRSIGDDRG
ncbi:adenosylmethionine decarboxylase [Candidatus Bathyarchaeota archaeon]|jgi:S-adenosylmethionine decarboxylase|nr:adenosylmethionine decarboxylase [Candidatus Bathyarchaeota archaeon]MDP6048430.1 adenosylmethionine decarboxylase [Candidatus Bathyarchaeota archaeon]MDP7208017.1 adenosylmethionine decarboxylase [Candidatus Bathyarchaeota archaeon]MDP7442932.1 adenosylmethionine decarboxylase [Candidatus Bathyarchaeota archaeon]|tara:strand:+ start:47 stop:400 length:354 start_codon:yes stop_codon:yes gene_type:complete